jgi:hypothetical protein
MTTEHEEEEWKPDPTDLLWNPPCSLPLKYWKRSEETQKAKDDHIDYLETLPYSREELIFQTTLSDGREAAIEKNLFPYDCPSPIEHFTLWSREELSHRRICMFMEDWCAENNMKVVEWNYEENLHRSFDIPHVHVFIRFEEKETPSTNEVRPELFTRSSKRAFSSIDDDGETTDEDEDWRRRKSTKQSSSEACSPHKNVCSTCFKSCSISSRSFSSEGSTDEGYSDGEVSDDNWSSSQKNVRVSEAAEKSNQLSDQSSPESAQKTVCSDENTMKQYHPESLNDSHRLYQ